MPCLLASLALAAASVAQVRPSDRLANDLGDRRRSAAAVEQLVAVGAPAAPVVGDVLMGGDEHARRAAVMVVRRLGPRASTIVPRLVAALADCPPERAPVLYDAIAAAIPLDSRPPQEIRSRLHVLTERLVARSGDADAMAARRGFVRCLIRMNFAGSDPEVAWRHVQGNFVIAREVAAELLARTEGGLAPDRLARLRELLDDVPRSCNGQARAFGATFEVEDRFAMALAHAVESQQGSFLDDQHAHAYRLLHGDAALRVQAAALLAHGRPQVAVAHLADALDDPSARVVAEAATSLGIHAGWIAAHPQHPAVPRLEALATDPDPLVAACARTALERVGGSGGR